MVRKIASRDENGAVKFVCASTDALADWDDGCAAACPEGYGAGSAMTVINESTHAVTGFGFFDGLAWNTL